MKITANFTLEELVHSSTADKYNIDNTPNETEKDNLIRLAKTILQPIREEYGYPIIVNSAFRSKQVNAKVGGSKTSQHMLGEAADIKAYDGDNKKLFNLIYKMMKLNKIQVGQLIDEYGYSWVHISLPRKNKPNNQILHLK